MACSRRRGSVRAPRGCALPASSRLQPRLARCRPRLSICSESWTMAARGGNCMWGKLAVGLFAAFALTTRADAGPALLFDAADGRILYAEDQDDQWHPASLTKIM